MLCHMIWSTTHHDQSSYQIWKLSDQRPQSYELCSQSTTIYWKCMKKLQSHNSTKIVKSKWWDNMINYTTCWIIPRNMKAIKQKMTSCIHKVKQDGRTNRHFSYMESLLFIWFWLGFFFLNELIRKNRSEKNSIFMWLTLFDI